MSVSVPESNGHHSAVSTLLAADPKMKPFSPAWGGRLGGHLTEEQSEPQQKGPGLRGVDVLVGRRSRVRQVAAVAGGAAAPAVSPCLP